MAALTSLDEFPFDFYGEIFSVVLASDRRLYLPLNRVCDALQIDANAQAQRIRRDEAISDALVQLPLQVPYGEEGAVQTRQVLCLWLNRLPYWLGTIDANRIKDQVRRQQIIRFKREFAEVAWAAFRSEILPEDMLAELDATAPPAEQQYYAVMDEAAAMRRDLGQQKERLQEVEERLTSLEARLVGTDFINSAQAKQYQDIVAILGSMLQKKGKGNYATVHAEVKKQFKVPSYQLIPEKDFPKLVNYLTRWYERLTPPGTPLPEVFTQPEQRRLF
ncbi:MAG: ORF6C domain-containing protein [Caldilineaceae bacterium]|nr:ORF6C domain-containing protein [Caldilineaceae bacterium]